VTHVTPPPLLRALAQVNSRISWLLGIVLGASLAALVAVELMQMVMRYAFNSGFAWITSVQTELLLCIAWFGVAKLWIERRSLSISNSSASDDSAQDSEQSRSTKKYSDHLSTVIPIMTSLLMLTGAILVFPYVWEIRDVYGGIDMPGLTVSAAIKSFPLLLAMICIAFACVVHLIEDVAYLRKV